DEQGLWTRRVLDDDLQWGHAVWCANLDDDADDELIIGVRDNKSKTVLSGLRIYDPQDASGRQWSRHLFDAGGVAIEDLAATDLNGDGRIDIVASGRATKNVKIYWNETK
ncbi:MAG TPA: VCBS repeat-containing protein, partial [Pirellulales bacterium]|nr:VCBS repeat-containing protein [Pirellulales bacterium]